MSKKIMDQEARTKIEKELTTNFLIEAGAGSGKTTSLVSRMVNLIYTETCKVHELAAITFTKKAADELKVRFQSEIEKAWTSEQDPEKRECLGEALQKMDQCFLGTVHSFCAKLLRERPIEAKLDIDFKELEESQDLELLEESWDSFLQTIQEKEPQIIDQLLELGVPVEEQFENLKMMKDFQDVQWMTERRPKPELQETFEALKMVLKEAGRALPEMEPQKGYDKLQSAITVALRKMRHMNHKQDKDIIDVFEQFDKNLKPTYNRWMYKEDAEYFYDKIRALAEMKIVPLLKQWREYIHSDVISFLRQALNEYESLKDERSLLNFQDLLLTARSLLRDNAEVRNYFQQKYHSLLVDEFQDTDPVQAEIMFYLTSVNTNETQWTKCKPLPGSLFVVGDPKQAIYRFRRADMDTYNRVKQLMVEHGGEVLQLTMNFRTLDSITENLNEVFEQQLPETETAYQAAYLPLNAYHKDKQTAFSGIKSLMVPAEFTRKDDVIKKDAENIARTIQQLRKEEGFTPSDFMVLTRYNDSVGHYAKILEEHNMPVSVSGEMAIGDMIEFQELKILLSTFTDPSDPVLFTAALRGVFFGISDNELYQWKRNGGRFSIYSPIPDQLNKRTVEKFTTALTRLRTYHKWVRILSPTTAIERIMEDAGFYPLLLLNNHGKRAFKSLLQILDALRKTEAEGFSDYRDVFTLLADMVDEKTVVVNMEEETDAIRVMNVHKSKGLEAPIVFLAHPWKQVNPESSIKQHIKRDDTSSKGYFSFYKNISRFHKKPVAMPFQWNEIKQEELHYLTEEEKRILYVAATRAEKALIISGSEKNNRKNPWKTLLEVPLIENLKGFTEQSEQNETAIRMITEEEYPHNHTENQYNWMKQAEKPSYESFSPTANKDYQSVLQIDREAGGGKEWGTIIHTVLEHLVNEKPIELLIEHLLAAYNFSKEKETEVYDYINQFKQSKIWSELQHAETILTEVPIGLRAERGSELYSLIADNHEVEAFHVKGIIDLVYKVNHRWKIIDYKTDRVKRREDKKRLEEYYQSQLEIYQSAWEQLTGERADTQIWGLFFYST
ncbi:UvrD-helicase domain-containing protein [Salinibacillus aidingensis]|uniref:DNA 3'-5' helicase n=1 Tax=Salinibacillus aidingensis TaxID=237684 RepID=A0ABP3KLE3_9BACI